MNVRKDSQALSARFYFASSGGEIQEGREKADETIPPSAAEPGKGFFLSFSCHAGDFGLPLCCWILISSSFWPCACPV